MLKRIAQLESISSTDSDYLYALRSIKQLLNKIDFKTEIIPLDDSAKLKSLLIYLKGSQLSTEELLVVEKLVQ